MAYSNSTDALRIHLATIFKASLAGVTSAGFGDGGHDPQTGLAIPVVRSQTALNNQLISVPVSPSDIISTNNGFWVEITGRLVPADLIGEQISEFGIFVGNTLVGLRNSTPITKESDEELDRTLTFKF